MRSSLILPSRSHDCLSTYAAGGSASLCKHGCQAFLAFCRAEAIDENSVRD